MNQMLLQRNNNLTSGIENNVKATYRTSILPLSPETVMEFKDRINALANWVNSKEVHTQKSNYDYKNVSLTKFDLFCSDKLEPEAK